MSIKCVAFEYLIMIISWYLSLFIFILKKVDKSIYELRKERNKLLNVRVVTRIFLNFRVCIAELVSWIAEGIGKNRRIDAFIMKDN